MNAAVSRHNFARALLLFWRVEAATSIATAHAAFLAAQGNPNSEAMGRELLGRCHEAAGRRVEALRELREGLRLYRRRREPGSGGGTGQELARAATPGAARNRALFLLARALGH